MFLPYSTDAPIYYWPIATAALILLNALIFFAVIFPIVTPGDLDAVVPYTLELGVGLRPTQWLTANFLHVDVMHLLGNMFGLWTFGLIVEGKIGWWRFLLVYCGLGILSMCAIQCCSLMLGGWIALGASGAIYGLIGVALIWAPENEVRCFMLLGFRPILFSLTIAVASVLYISLELVILCFTGLGITSQLIHLVGALFGLGVGVAMLRLCWVDCENWDLFSVWAGRDPVLIREIVPPVSTPTDAEMAERRSADLKQLESVLAESRYELAVAVHRRLTQQDANWHLPEPAQRKLIVGCLEQKRYDDAVTLMQEYLRVYTEQAVPVRLKLAQVLLEHQGRAALARRVLAQVPESALNESHRRLYHSLAAKANSASEEGFFELQDDA